MTKGSDEDKEAQKMREETEEKHMEKPITADHTQADRLRTQTQK